MRFCSWKSKIEGDREVPQNERVTESVMVDYEVPSHSLSQSQAFIVRGAQGDREVSCIDVAYSLRKSSDGDFEIPSYHPRNQESLSSGGHHPAHGGLFVEVIHGIEHPWSSGKLHA